MTKNTSEEQGDRELKNIKEIYNLLVLRILVVSEHAFGTGPVPVWARLDFFDYDS